MQKMTPQNKLVIILNFVIVALVVGLFFVYKSPTKQNEDPPASTLPDIYTSWQADIFENNESPVAAFASPDGNAIHIFGNSARDGKDRIFFAEVADGKVSKKTELDIDSFLTQKNRPIYGYTLKKACIAEGGYMLAFQGLMNASGGSIDVSFVALADYEGQITHIDVHTAVSPERIADAFYSGGKLFMIVRTGYSELNLNNIKIYKYSTDVKLEDSLSADHLGDMEYLFMADYRNGYLMCFNVNSLSNKCAAFAYITPGTNATFYYADMSVGYKALDFTVTADGYALLCVDDNGDSFLLKISKDFKITNTSYFPKGDGDKNKGKIIYSDRGYFIHSGGANKLYLYDSALNESSELDGCDYLCDSAENGNTAVITAIRDNDLRVYVINNEKKVIDLKPNGNQTVAILIRLNSGLAIVSNDTDGDKSSCIAIKLNGDSIF